MRTTRHARHCCAQNVDHLAHDNPFSAFFAEVVCTLGTTSPHVVAALLPIGGELHYMRVRHADDTPPEGFK